MARTLAVNVDVDGLPLYYRIHGLSCDPMLSEHGALAAVAWERGVRRFLELFGTLGLRATFFVVGRDLAHPAVRSVAADAVRLGHELASHSHTHPYNLIHLKPSRIREEIALAEHAIEAVRGAPVRGFRGPGYNINAEVLETLGERGYLYDSSILPSPAYYAARALAITAIGLRGRTSQSIVGDPLAALGRRGPYRLQRGRLLELPITVLPLLRVPVIGTSLALTPTPVLAHVLAPALRRMNFVNLEFHAMDLLDATDPGCEALARYQPDVTVPVGDKRTRYATVLRHLSEGADNQTLEAIAQSF